MSIQDIASRIKAKLPGKREEPGNTEIIEFDARGRVVKRSLLDKFFLSLVIVLVALGAFGLGKLDGAGERKPIEIRYEDLDNAQTSKSQPANAVSATGQGRVVVSKNGSKYHYEYCPGAKQISEENKIVFASAEAAEQAGYTLAGNCKQR